MQRTLEFRRNNSNEDAYRAIGADWTLIEDPDWSWDLEYMDFYFGQDYQFDSYWLCDMDKNRTLELFL